MHYASGIGQLIGYSFYQFIWRQTCISNALSKFIKVSLARMQMSHLVLFASS